MAVRGSGLKVCRFPARAYLLQVKNKVWLWDTSYASHFETHTRSGVYQLYPKVTPVYFDPKEALVKQLSELGLNLPDVAGLVITHFHGDHIAGLHDFPKVPLYCRNSGWDEARRVRSINAVRKGIVPGLIPHDFDERVRFVEGMRVAALPTELAPFEWGWELPESDGEAWIVPLPGHAAGHIGVFVQTDLGWVLLASDAAWAPDNYRKLKEPFVLASLVLDDYPQFRQTLKKLNQLDCNDVVDIRLCHEGSIA